MIPTMATGGREKLTQDDAQILRLESPVIKGHTGKVLIVAPGPGGRALSVERLREQVGERMAAFPRLGQRVEEPRFGLGRPAWVDAPEVDLAWHVAEPHHADPLSDEELRRAVGDLLSERLDHTRPLWRFDALPLTGDRTALVARIHHAMADGVSAIRLAADQRPLSAPRDLPQALPGRRLQAKAAQVEVRNGFLRALGHGTVISTYSGGMSTSQGKKALTREQHPR